MNSNRIEEKRDALIKRLEIIVRGSGDVTLSVEPFFDKVVRALTAGNCSIPTTVEVYELPIDFVEDVVHYISEVEREEEK